MDDKIKFLLQGHFALVHPAAAFSLLVLSTAWAKNLQADTSKKQQEGPQTVIVSAIPGVLRLTKFWKSEDYVCADFYVRAVKHPVTEVLITSTGLGQATFSLPFNSILTECAKANSKESIVMNLRDLDCNARKVRLRLPRVSFPETGSVVEAKILVFVPPKESIEIPLRLEGQTASSFLTAATWFLGIFIPTLMTGLLGYLWYILQKQWDARSAEQSAFEQYK
jgi:hypothetical protein